LGNAMALALRDAINGSKLEEPTLDMVRWQNVRA
jgi:hypothetical protein